MRAAITVEFDMPQHVDLLEVAKSIAAQLNQYDHVRIANRGDAKVVKAELLK